MPVYYESRTCPNCGLLGDYRPGVLVKCGKCGQRIPETQGTYIGLGRWARGGEKGGLAGKMRDEEAGEALRKAVQESAYGVRAASSGATRDSNEGKPDFRAILSPAALMMFGAYMVKHNTQRDGQKREPDNWKKGMPLSWYIESFFRHTVQLHAALEHMHEDAIIEHMCACLFNLQGMMDIFAGGPTQRLGAHASWPPSDYLEWRRRLTPGIDECGSSD